MRQAANVKDVEWPMLLPGIRINTSATDHYPLKRLQMIQFDRARWVHFGQVMGN